MSVRSGSGCGGRGLAGIVGEGQVLDGDARESLADASRAQGVRGRADAVVLPGSAEEVAAVVAWCYEHDAAVVPRGGGTGYAAGAVPLDGGVVLGLERLGAVRAPPAGGWRGGGRGGAPPPPPGGGRRAGGGRWPGGRRASRPPPCGGARARWDCCSRWIPARRSRRRSAGTWPRMPAVRTASSTA